MISSNDFISLIGDGVYEKNNSTKNKADKESL